MFSAFLAGLWLCFFSSRIVTAGFYNMPVSTQNTDIITASYGRPVVLAYGRHVAGGNIILQDESDPARTVVFAALGEGVWDGIDSLNINGVDIDLSTSTVFHFHKGLDGQLSAGNTLDPEGVGSPYDFSSDGDQKADLFTPDGIQGLSFSRTAYLGTKVPFDEFAPTGALTFQGIFRARQVRTFDSGGSLVNTMFSDNPAWQILDLLTLIRGLPDSRIDIPSFSTAAAYCDALITINAVNVKRFISNIAFTQSVDLDQALLALLATCRGTLTDIAGKISLRIDQTRNSVFDFSMNNIVEGSFSAQYQDTRPIANRLQMSFRDTENNYTLVSPLLNHDAQQFKFGRVVVANLELGNLPSHQAERVGNYLLIRAIDNNLYVKLKGDPTSLKVMPGDVVRVAHDAAPWGPQGPASTGFETFEVLEVSENGDETRDLLLQIYDSLTYPDTGGPSQGLVTTNLERSFPRPAPIPSGDWEISSDKLGNLYLAWSGPDTFSFDGADVDVIVDLEGRRSGPTDTLASDLADTDTTLHLGDTNRWLVGDFLSASDAGLPASNEVAEILQITGPGDIGRHPSSATVNVDRSLRGSIAASLRVSGSGLYRLVGASYHFPATLRTDLSSPVPGTNYFLSAIQPGTPARILAASLTVSAAGRTSDPSENSQGLFGWVTDAYTWDGALQGLRVSEGRMLALRADGPLQAIDDLTDTISVDPGTVIRFFFAKVPESAQGQDIIGQVLINDTNTGGWTTWGPQFTIPVAAGGGPANSASFASGAQQGNTGDRFFALRIAQVGTDNPGRDLIVTGYF